MEQIKAFDFVRERDRESDGTWKCAKCGKVLVELSFRNFAHEFLKGKYPEHKCNPDKIRIFCFVCHNFHDHNIETKSSTLIK